MISSRIIGNDGDALKVSEEGAIGVVQHQHPYLDETVNALPFRQYFTDNGVIGGSNDMTLDGSVTPQEFYISASPDYDIFIKYITCEIGDTGSLALNKFGAEPALTNGVSFYYDTQIEPDYVLHEGIKTNKEFIRIASDTTGIGTGTEAFLADVSGGGTEKSYLPNMAITEAYGFIWGIRLKKGSNDRIMFRVNDDLTGLTTFNAIATGTRI